MDGHQDLPSDATSRGHGRSQTVIGFAGLRAASLPRTPNIRFLPMLNKQFLCSTERPVLCVPEATLERNYQTTEKGRRL